MGEPLLDIRNLKTCFYTEDGIVPAIEDVSFSLNRGETVGIVGESGSGKSVTALSVMRLIPNPPGRIEAGEVVFEGENLLEKPIGEMRQIRGNEIAMIFQEPMTSLNPVLTVGDQIMESIILHQRLGKQDAKDKAVHMLKLVGIPSPERRVNDYPHQMSGGMRQRVMIAMALSCNPKLLIADEPTTALDVTVQAQILELMMALKDELGTSVMLITHDLGVIAETADKVVVMYAGKVVFDGVDVFSLNKADMRALRKEMQIVFQDPYASLNPRMTIGQIIGEPLEVHGMASGVKKQKRVEELLEEVGLSAYHANRYPHEFSGGQRQRIGIARALAVDPKLIVCDEPVSALDVSIQAQVINLLQDLQDRLGLTYLFIAHDLSVVEHISNRVAVMYLGKLVELATKEDLYKAPMHPYTQALLSAVPVPDPETRKERILLKGEIPSPINPPSGCRFHPRCPHAQEACSVEDPEFVQVGDRHFVACHLHGLRRLGAA
jgi:oligopeptide transport system ATP-binding protein